MLNVSARHGRASQESAKASAADFASPATTTGTSHETHSILHRQNPQMCSPKGNLDHEVHLDHGLSGLRPPRRRYLWRPSHTRITPATRFYRRPENIGCEMRDDAGVFTVCKIQDHTWVVPPNENCQKTRRAGSHRRTGIRHAVSPGQLTVRGQQHEPILLPAGPR